MGYTVTKSSIVPEAKDVSKSEVDSSSMAPAPASNDAVTPARVRVMIESNDHAKTLLEVIAYAKPGEGTTAFRLPVDCYLDAIVQQDVRIHEGERSVELELPGTGKWYVGILFGIGGQRGKQVVVVEDGMSEVHFSLPRLQTISLLPKGIDAIHCVASNHEDASISIQQVSEIPRAANATIVAHKLRPLIIRARGN